MTNSDSVLVVPKHGRGSIKQGGNYGNRGGGRQRNEIRELLEGDLEAARHQLRDMLEAGTLTLTEIVRYAEFAGRYTVPVPKAGYDQALIDELILVRPPGPARTTGSHCERGATELTEDPGL